MPLKLGLISDVHGDTPGLELAWAHLAALGADKVVCAGDVVGYGPDPDGVCAFLAAHAVPVARGNHDRWAIRRGLREPDEYGGGLPGQRARAFLADLPTDLILEDGGRVAVIVHASLRSDMEFVRPATHPPAALRADLQFLDADLLVHGHTHLPMWYRDRWGLVVNPGSLVDPAIVRSSRTFALVDLDELGVTFHDLQTGREVEVPPWPEPVEALPGPR